MYVQTTPYTGVQPYRAPQLRDAGNQQIIDPNQLPGAGGGAFGSLEAMKQTILGELEKVKPQLGACYDRAKQIVEDKFAGKSVSPEDETFMTAISEGRIPNCDQPGGSMLLIGGGLLALLILIWLLSR